MMPYLDSSYVFGNTCVEPNAWIREDMISTGAQKLKTALSKYGITYSAQFGFNYTGLTGGGLNGKTDFPSYNGSLLTNITISATTPRAAACTWPPSSTLATALTSMKGTRAPPPPWVPSRTPPAPSRGRTRTSAT